VPLVTYSAKYLIKKDKYYKVLSNQIIRGGAMSRKLVFSVFLLLVFFQASCVSQVYRPNTHIKIHDSNTVYGLDVLGKTKSFTKGKIVSSRDVQVQWQELEKDTAGKETGKEVEVRSFATEFVIEPDSSETFLFVQYNEEELKAGERILLLKENSKIRIVRDRSVNKNTNE
jgi:outer membrane lipoprotein SlyB